jgi:hypothetical protein
MRRGSDEIVHTRVNLRASEILVTSFIFSSKSVKNEQKSRIVVKSLWSISPIFYMRKFLAQLSRTYILVLYFFGARKLAQKLLIKCWWNWPLYWNKKEIIRNRKYFDDAYLGKRLIFFNDTQPLVFSKIKNVRLIREQFLVYICCF